MKTKLLFRYLHIIIFYAVTATSSPPPSDRLKMSVLPNGSIQDTESGEISADSTNLNSDVLNDLKVPPTPGVRHVQDSESSEYEKQQSDSLSETQSSETSESESLPWYRRFYGGGSKSKKKKSKFLAAVPMIFKVLMFWWCALLLGGAIFIILDHVYLRYLTKNGHFLTWSVSHCFALKNLELQLQDETLEYKTENQQIDKSDSAFKFSLEDYRDELWTMLVDVPKWNPKTHPTLLEAEIVGPPTRLDRIGAKINMRPKHIASDMTEAEIKELVVTRETMNVEPKTRFDFATVSETLGGFISIDKLQCTILIDTINEDKIDNTNGGVQVSPNRGSENGSQKDSGNNSSPTITESTHDDPSPESANDEVLSQSPVSESESNVLRNRKVASSVVVNYNDSELNVTSESDPTVSTSSKDSDLETKPQDVQNIVNDKASESLDTVDHDDLSHLGPSVRLTIYGSGYVMSRILNWYFVLDGGQIEGMKSYLESMERCVREKISVKKKYCSNVGGGSDRERLNVTEKEGSCS